jgi:hypothetical protein
MSKSLRSLLLAMMAVGAMSAAAAWQTGSPPSDPPKELVGALRDSALRYWKGNLHTHSFWSDGDDFPEMVADWYKRHGYHFLTLSDHNVLSEGERWIDSEVKGRGVALKKYRARFGERWVEERLHKDKPQVRLKPLAEFRSLLEEPGRFLLIQGEEITHRFAKAPVHINAINLRDVVKPLDGDSIAETMRVNHRAVFEQRERSGWRMIAFLNHPNFGWGIRAEDMMLTEELRFFEVYNGHPGVRNYGDDVHPSCERLWDIVLALRLGKHRLPVVYGLATDDAHGYHAWGVGKVNPGRGWVMVRAPYLTPEAVVRALEAGDFYSSTGVLLKDVRRTGDRLSLTIQPEPGVRYKTQFIATFKDAALTSEPRKDDKGKLLQVTRIYSDDLGKVVAESDDFEPSYRLTGRELYVRAKVTSTKLHPNPYGKGDFEVAWTQPVAP